MSYYVENYLNLSTNKTIHVLHDDDVGTVNEGRVYASFNSEEEAIDWIEQEEIFEQTER